MVITWYGQSCFRVQSGEAVLAIDPFSKAIGLTPPRFRADFVLVTHGHPDHAHTEAISGNPFTVAGPGEYEHRGVRIQGIATFHDKSHGKERGANTVYTIAMEDIRLAHLGDFGEGVMRDETVEAIGDIDILMIPVGGKYTLNAEEAAHVVREIEPKIVIPMHYKIPGLAVPLEGVERFLKETGGGGKAAQEKLTVRKRDLGEKEKTEVVVLKVE